MKARKTEEDEAEDWKAIIVGGRPGVGLEYSNMMIIHRSDDNDGLIVITIIIRTIYMNKNNNNDDKQY